MTHDRLQTPNSSTSQRKSEPLASLGMALQAGLGAFTGVQQEAEEVRSQMSALRCTAAGLAGQVGPAVAALLAANPPYQPPPQEDKVTMAVSNTLASSRIRILLMRTCCPAVMLILIDC